MSDEKDTSEELNNDVEQIDELDISSDAAAAADAESGDASRSDGLDLTSLKKDLKEANDRCLRAQAELDNVRKRTRRELEERSRYASLPIANDLLSVVDNLQRALSAAPETEEAASFVQGVKMVCDQLATVLENHQCKKIDAVGEPFDPNLHEAIQMEASDEFAANTVSREIQIGYQIFDRVVRPSQVFVSTGPANQ